MLDQKQCFNVNCVGSVMVHHILGINWSSSSKLKFYASQQWLAGAVALVGYQAFFPARFWPTHQACSVIYSRWNGPSHSEMKAFLVPLLWLLQPGNHSQAFLPRLMHSPHQSWAEFTIKVESNLFAMAFPSLWVSSVYWKRSWVLSSDQAHKRELRMMGPIQKVHDKANMTAWHLFFTSVRFFSANMTSSDRLEALTRLIFLSHFIRIGSVTEKSFYRFKVWMTRTKHNQILFWNYHNISCIYF